jgi:dolichol-phosphate mannosyltransferase
MVAWIGFRQIPLHYRREKRFAGETKYPLRKMLTFAIDAITGFAVIPLRVSLYVASIFIGLAGLLTIYVLFSWLYLGVVSGWTSMFIGMLIFSSVQLFSLAIIGEYIGRIFTQTKQRPLFIIREIVTARIEQPPLMIGESARNA